MSFEIKAKKVRKKLANYNTISVIQLLLKYLHDKSNVSIEAERRPWIACLALDWAFEMNPKANTPDATSQNVYQILQDIWDMQADAAGLGSGKDYKLPLRKMLIPQLRFQINPQQHIIFLFRFSSMLYQEGASSSPRDDFKNITTVDLERFLIFSTWVQINFTQLNSSYISYGDFIGKSLRGFYKA